MSGGGGAGAAGGCSQRSDGCNLGAPGGAGRQSDITGSNQWYCAGGGTGTRVNQCTAGDYNYNAGGQGGGGAGGNPSHWNGYDATTYGSAGGGAAGNIGDSGLGGYGYQGVVILRFLNCFNVTTSKTGNGTISPTECVEPGEDYDVLITPDSGYYISQLLVDGNEFTMTDAQRRGFTYSFTNISASHTISANFAEGFKITNSICTGGSVVRNCPIGDWQYTIDSTFIRCDQPCFRVQANPNFKISLLAINGYVVSEAYGQTTYDFDFGMIHSDQSVNVCFVATPYIARVNGQGKVCFGGVCNDSELAAKTLGSLQPGTNILTIEPASHRHLQYLEDCIVDGTCSEPVIYGGAKNKSYTITGNDNAHTALAIFREDTYLILLDAKQSTVGFQHIIATQDVHYYYNQGEQVTIDVTANAGYYLTVVFVDDVRYPVNAEFYDYTYTMGDPNDGTSHTVSVETSPNPVVTTSVKSSGGTITPTFPASYGSTPTITFTPNTGYFLTTIKVTNSKGTNYYNANGTTYTLDPVYEDTQVEVEFVRAYLVEIGKEIDECSIKWFRKTITADTMFKISGEVENKDFLLEIEQDVIGNHNVYLFDNFDARNFNTSLNQLPVKMTGGGVTTFQVMKSGEQLYVYKLW
jgi:hypothetical protein